MSLRQRRRKQAGNADRRPATTCDRRRRTVGRRARVLYIVSWCIRIVRDINVLISDWKLVYFTSSGARNVVRAPSLIKCGVQSEGGHRAVVLQGSEGCGRTTALRRFVRLVAAYCEGDDSSPLVVARRVSWPGRTAVDLLCDVVAQLSEVVNVGDAPSDD